MSMRFIGEDHVLLEFLLTNGVLLDAEVVSVSILRHEAELRASVTLVPRDDRELPVIRLDFAEVVAFSFDWNIDSPYYNVESFRAVVLDDGSFAISFDPSPETSATIREDDMGVVVARHMRGWFVGAAPDPG